MNKANRSRFQCADILEEEDSVELNDLVEDVIVDEVVTSVDDINEDEDEFTHIQGLDAVGARNRNKKSESIKNQVNQNMIEQMNNRSNNNQGGAVGGINQLDTSYSSSGECSTASSEYSALRFRDSPMSSSSR